MTAIVMVMMSDEEVAVFARASEPGYGAMRTPRGLLPLVAMDIDARVVGIIAATEVAQTFVNTTGGPIEATYIFPLPDRAAVHRFRMEVGGRIIEGTIDERGRARDNYDAAIAQGHRAAVAEEERPGVFTMRVGNLMPGEAATVLLSLIGPLPVDDGEITFQFPLVVAPRYMPGHGLSGDQAGLGSATDTNLVPDASRISPPVLLPGVANPVRLGLRVSIEDTQLGGVASSLHAVVTSHRDAFVVEVQPGERLDRDFILRWRIDPAAAAQLRSQLVCADDADGRGGTFMLTLVPPSTASVAAKPRDLVFVLDRSGSMEGWKMVAARRATARMIDSLTSRDRFCAIAFDNTLELLPGANLVEATDRARFRAVEALAKVDARGGTEMAEPLRRAAQLLSGYDDRERAIVLVTDGQIGNEDHILVELAPHLRNIRVFALGIDNAVNAGFLRRLAGSAGQCELVESEDRLDQVMDGMHRRLGAPIATELQLRGHDLDLDVSAFAPRRLPDVYAGAAAAIFGRYRGRAPLTAAIELTSSTIAARVPRSDTGATGWLAASWARAHIRDLEDRYAANPNSWDKDQLEREIVQTSKHFGVLSRFTAFLAVDRDQVVNPGGRLHEVVQPVHAAARGRVASAPAPSIGGAPRAPMAQPMMGMPPAMPGRAAAAPRPAPAKAMAPQPSYSAMDDESASFDHAYAAPELEKRELSETTPRAPAPPRQAFLTRLGELARDLLANVADLGALRRLRHELALWIDDVRALGNEDALVATVERILAPFLASFATPGHTPAIVPSIAAALIATSNGMPLPPPPKGSSRGAFWK